MQNNQLNEYPLLSQLSEENQLEVNQLWVNGGVLSAETVEAICLELSISTEDLMLLLLPIAASFSFAPISSFKVGAVVKGLTKTVKQFSNLYLGANFEFKNLSLNFSIHAEQSAVSNAWMKGEAGIDAIATSAAPCGHCRQFLYEISGDHDLTVVIPSKLPNQRISIDIQSLLPFAFGPKELKCEYLLMQDTRSSEHFCLAEEVKDSLTLETLEQAKLSYAPYTKNYAACSIELKNKTKLFGRSAENAAHNPSLSAFASVISQLPFCQTDSKYNADNLEAVIENIKRVVFVENPMASSQKEYASLLLSKLNKNVEIEYHQMKLG